MRRDGRCNGMLWSGSDARSVCVRTHVSIITRMCPHACAQFRFAAVFTTVFGIGVIVLLVVPGWVHVLI